MNKKRKRIIEANEVSEIREYELGGYRQKVLIEGKSRKNPVVIFLHGGPGMPIPFSVGCRGLFPEYTEHLVMVYWDQLGCGINNRVIDDSFTIDQFADMAVDLVKAVRREFPDNKLTLLATSWGTVLAAKAASRTPELIDRVIAMGQVRRELTFNQETYGILEKAGLPKAKRVQLEEIKGRREHGAPDIKAVMGMVQKYTEGYQSKSGEKAPMGPVIRGLLTSPDYSIRDLAAIVKNGYGRNTSIWPELLKLDLSEILENMSIPYRILQGDKDIVTSTAGMKVFVEKCGNPMLSLRILENCGHFPGKAAMDAVLEECL